MSPDTLEQRIRAHDLWRIIFNPTTKRLELKDAASDIARALEAGYDAVGMVVPHNIQVVFEPAFIANLESEGDNNDS